MLRVPQTAQLCTQRTSSSLHRRSWRSSSATRTSRSRCVRVVAAQQEQPHVSDEAVTTPLSAGTATATTTVATGSTEEGFNSFKDPPVKDPVDGFCRQTNALFRRLCLPSVRDALEIQPASEFAAGVDVEWPRITSRGFEMVSLEGFALRLITLGSRN